MRKLPWLLMLTITLGIAQLGFTDQGNKPNVNVPKIPARAGDVKTIDGMINAYYEVISGPAGQPRQWSRDRTLYISDIRFVSDTDDKSGHPKSEIMSHQEFVDRSDAEVVRTGFYEKEVHRTTERFGNIAHVFSTYESRHAASDAAPFARGINSIQLLKDGNRWWIVTVFWDAERPGNTLPAQYLPKQ